MYHWITKDIQESFHTLKRSKTLKKLNQIKSDNKDLHGIARIYKSLRPPLWAIAKLYKSLRTLPWTIARLYKSLQMRSGIQVNLRIKLLPRWKEKIDYLVAEFNRIEEEEF
jgi:hypothetical protein